MSMEQKEILCYACNSRKHVAQELFMGLPPGLLDGHTKLENVTHTQSLRCLGVLSTSPRRSELQACSLD
jgi:hypothetical protein